MNDCDDIPNGWQLFHSPSATSSSDLALSYLADNPAAHGVAFLVDEQTKGRGRQGRFWNSNNGDGMYLSVILAPKRDIIDWASLSFLTSLSLLQAVQKIVPGNADKLKLKWPNDVLADGHKIAGILLEAYPPALIIGCGVNLTNAPQIAGRKVPIGDLAKFSNRDIGAFELASAFLHCLAENLMGWHKSDGPRSYIRSWRGFCDMIGQPIEVSLQGNRLTGRCTSIDDEGVLILEDVTGMSHRITTGDVHIMKTPYDEDSSATDV
ncbi:MAG: biotin--[acetyl-CoA-carboxylase] ligase [Alphaproteobacteria bacterium]|nr:biotin--[acetyl-CoA-carboxylase] ligase [Alphaproteobacteria bacterium]